MGTDPGSVVNMLYCYAHEDEAYCLELEKHLASFKRQGYLVSWSDHQVAPGVDWRREIAIHLTTANLIVLLLSPDFMYSDACHEEMRQALAFAREGRARVVPILLRSVIWQQTPLADFQILPPDGKPITLWEDRDEAWQIIAFSIGQVISSMLGIPPLDPTPVAQEPVVLPLLAFEPRNPYKGLQAFTEDDVHDFFGRDDLVDKLAASVEEIVLEEQKKDRHIRVLTVLGASGSGKSSVVMAGLIPNLRSGGVFNSKEWVYLNPIVPGADPLESLIIAFKSYFPDTSFKTLREDLEGEATNGLHLLATQLVKKKEEKVVLVVDQFEEVFTLTTDEARRKHFLDLLVTAATEPHGPVFLILALRADFYGRLMEYPQLYQLIDAHHVSAFPLEREELRSVIEQPAKLPDVQLVFEKGLVEELFFAMQGQSGALPLLEFALDQLVQRRKGHLLTLQAYHDMGGIRGALFQHAERTYQELQSDEHRQAARDIFLRLIAPGISKQDITRRRAARSEFDRADPRQARLMQDTLEAFVEARLLTTNHIGEKTTVEVSHETLLREWKRLSEWLQEASNDIRFQQSLSEDVVEWELRKRPKDRLYRGASLKEARTWAKRNTPSTQEMAFLRSSETQHKQGILRLTLIVVLLVASLSVATWFGLNRPASSTLVTTLQDNVVGSLRWCINTAPTGSTIHFAQGLHGTIMITAGVLVFASGKELTLVGPGANQLAISGGDASNSNIDIDISVKARVTISNLSFKNSKSAIDSFIYNEGELTLNNSVIAGNETLDSAGDSHSSNGGGIDNASTGTMTVIDSTITDNTVTAKDTDSYGGGIVNDGTLTVIDSTISQNEVFSKNKDSIGAGISNNGTMTVMHSIITNNSAHSGGHSAGGGILNLQKGTLTMISTTVSDNVVDGAQGSMGGGIFNAGKMSVETSTFSHNSVTGNARGEGGGIFNAKGGALAVTTSTFSSNKAGGNPAGIGGGLYNDNTGVLTVTLSTISGNVAAGSQGGLGGGIANNQGKLVVATSTLSGNSALGEAGGYGGGVYSYNPTDQGITTTLLFCTLYGNSASTDGGGIEVNATGKGYTILSDSLIAANQSHTGPDLSGMLISGDYNLVENVAGASGLNPATDMHIAEADIKIDSQLSNNGGPTQTLALLPGSPAIDAVPPQNCKVTITDALGHSVSISTDQRGKMRPAGAARSCDIGAYEVS